MCIDSGGFFMSNCDDKDTRYLLKEVNAGCKSATNSMEQVLPFVKDENLKRLIHMANETHIALGEKCHGLLNKYGQDEKDPDKVSSAMAFMGTEMKLIMGADTKKIAGMLMDGCNMGIQSLSKYLNQYKNANKESVDICNKLIKEEEKFMLDLKEYL